MKSLNIKNKIRNFFKIPNEVFEEGTSPEFEKVNLFTLTKNKIFLGILAFLLIVNLIVMFNLNQFYIRAILSFIFLITIPGLLIMLMLKIREVGFWEYLVYVVGLSVSFIMFGGLAVNWILPWLNITDKPLSLWPILICFNIFLLAFWITAWIRNKNFNSLKIQYPKLDLTNRIFFIVPMLFPIISILGAFLLNNHGTNILTMIMLGGIAVYVLLIIIFRKRLNENVFPWAILMISLALLFSGWMRSWYISGADVSLEYSIFNSNLNKGLWNGYLSNNYNAMMSISILPVIFKLLANPITEHIQKIFFPFLLSFSTLSIYLLGKGISKNKIIGFFATLFFIFQSLYTNWWGLPSRQQIAFLFFGLMLLALFAKDITPNLKKLLFILFGFSMIVSHYSTSYIALIIFLLSYLIITTHSLWKIKKNKAKGLPKKRVKSGLSFGVILILFAFSFLWLSQLTPVSSDLVDFAHKSFSNIEKIFSEEVQAKGSSVMSQFDFLAKNFDYEKEWNQYLNESYIAPDKIKILNEYPTNLKYIPANYNIDYKYSFMILSLREIIKLVGKLMLIFGTILLLFKFKLNYEFKILSASFILLLILFTMLPFVSIQYDLVRLHQQMLFILSLSSILGMSLIFNKNPVRKKFSFIPIMTIFLIVYFIFFSGIAQQVIGGYEGSMRLNNDGFEYSAYFSHKNEISSSIWLNKYSENRYLFVDSRALNKVLLINSERIISKDILPGLIPKNTYIFVGYNNLFEGIAIRILKGNTLTFSFPEKFLNENKNKIYANGGSEIFK